MEAKMNRYLTPAQAEDTWLYMTDTQRLKLISDVSLRIIRNTDSLYETSIGGQLAYLLAAIAANGAMEINPGMEDELLHLLAVYFPHDHPVWAFVIEVKDDTDDELAHQIGMLHGIEAYNEARGYDTTSPEPCGHHCPSDCPRCRDE